MKIVDYSFLLVFNNLDFYEIQEIFETAFSQLKIALLHNIKIGVLT